MKNFSSQAQELFAEVIDVAEGARSDFLDAHCSDDIGLRLAVERYNESVFTANTVLRASSVVVHLDTSRFEGWNEIDAVELVGRDGSRQWASSVSASSSYAD